MLCYCPGYESEFDAEDFLIFEWMAHRSWVHAFQEKIHSFRKTNGQKVS